MLFAYFDTSPVEAFADHLVANLKKTFPPQKCKSGSEDFLEDRKLAHSRIQSYMDSLISKSPLNLYQKAKLGLRLTEALSVAGYPANFAKHFSYDVVLQVAKVGKR